MTLDWSEQTYPGKVIPGKVIPVSDGRQWTSSTGPITTSASQGFKGSQAPSSWAAFDAATYAARYSEGNPYWWDGSNRQQDAGKTMAGTGASHETLTERYQDLARAHAKLARENGDSYAELARLHASVVQENENLVLAAAAAKAARKREILESADAAMRSAYGFCNCCGQTRAEPRYEHHVYAKQTT
jgi:RNA polymerase-binding transcription factor DksA